MWRSSARSNRARWRRACPAGTHRDRLLPGHGDCGPPGHQLPGERAGAMLTPRRQALRRCAESAVCAGRHGVNRPALVRCRLAANVSLCPLSGLGRVDRARCGQQTEYRVRVQRVSLASPLAIVLALPVIVGGITAIAIRSARAVRAWQDVLAAGVDIRQRAQAVEQGRLPGGRGIAASTATE